MDANFFKPTKEELKEASSGGIPVFKAGEEVIFLIKEVTEKTQKDGGQLLIVGCTILSGDNANQKYSFFFRNNATSKKILFAILGALFSEEQILGGNLEYIMAVGRQIKSVCKESPKKEGKGVWQNFYDFSEVSSTPDIGGHGITEDEIPF